MDSRAQIREQGQSQSLPLPRYAWILIVATSDDEDPLYYNVYSNFLEAVDGFVRDWYHGRYLNVYNYSSLEAWHEDNSDSPDEEGRVLFMKRPYREQFVDCFDRTMRDSPYSLVFHSIKLDQPLWLTEGTNHVPVDVVSIWESTSMIVSETEGLGGGFKIWFDAHLSIEEMILRSLDGGTYAPRN